jgi:hypothetical protein
MSCRARTLLTAALLVFVGASAGGCSLLIRKGGFAEGTVLHDGATPSSVRKAFGSPLRTTRFQAPTHLSEAVEVGAGSIPDPQRVALVLLREDYHYRGRLFRHRTNIEELALAYLTLGVTEIWTFPLAVLEATGESLTEHVFEVWYSPEGQYVYHRVRDVP